MNDGKDPVSSLREKLHRESTLDAFPLLASVLNHLLESDFSCIWDLTADGTMMSLRAIHADPPIRYHSAVFNIDPDYGDFLQNLKQPVCLSISRLPRYLFLDLVAPRKIQTLIAIPFADSTGTLLWHGYAHLTQPRDVAQRLLDSVLDDILTLSTALGAWWLAKTSSTLATVLTKTITRTDQTDPVPALRELNHALSAYTRIHFASYGRLSRPIEVKPSHLSEGLWDSKIRVTCVPGKCLIADALDAEHPVAVNDPVRIPLCDLHASGRLGVHSIYLIPVRHTVSPYDPIGIVEFCNRLISSATGTGKERAPFSLADISLIHYLLPFLRLFAHTLSMERHLSDIIADTTHELRNPITVIRDRASFIQRRRHQLDDTTVDQKLDDIIIDCQILNRVVSTLDATRPVIELRPDPRPCLLFRDVIFKVRKEIVPLLRERHFTVDAVDIRGVHMVPELLLDPGFMTLVFYNLLVNAVKYAHRDPDQFRIDITARQTTHAVEIDVADWGIGVPANEAERIFLRGHRAPNAIKLVASSKGLGLAIARTFMQAQGCSLDLTRGTQPTVFTVSIPVERFPPRTGRV